MPESPPSTSLTASQFVLLRMMKKESLALDLVHDVFDY